MTVQILDDTPAVVSLGKLCEEHGYTHEWASGQKPHLTKSGTRILCNTENVFPIDVPGLSSSSSASSSSTSQDSSSTSPSPARLRNDDTRAQPSANRGDPPEIRNKILKGGQQSSNEQSIARSPRVVRAVYRRPRRYRSASTRKHFSRFRFETPYGSDNQEAQYLSSLRE